jgi:FlaA1/EpsC-like NDP-sugar epimerase
MAKKMITLAGLVPGKDIKIRYTGLRPGEKLYEELLNVKEFTQPTYHEKIMIASVREYDYDKVSVEINDLIEFANMYKDYLVVKKMKKIVPEYISQNSSFEEIDFELKKHRGTRVNK